MNALLSLSTAAYALPDAVLQRLQTPALAIYLDKVRENLDRMRRYLGGDLARWRPHLKTTKMAPVYAELVRIGVRYFKVATTREARVILEVLDAERVSGADLLVAYPLVGPALGMLETLATRHPATRVSVLCEDVEVLRSIAPRLEVFVDVNPGMNRTGIPLDALARIEAVAHAAGTRFRGLHFYEGHVHGGDVEWRREQCFACYERLLECMRRLAAHGIVVRELITSGTPGFQHALAFAPFRELPGCTHQVSPGTVVFHDLRSASEIEEIDFVPAAVVLARVVSRPGHGMLTCDAGSKSIAAEQAGPCAFVLGHPDWQVQAPSEEHLPIRIPVANPEPRHGDIVYLVPYHVCPTVNLAEQAVLVENGVPLKSVPVDARAHELWLL